MGQDDFETIPVVDLLAGEVVRGQRGERATYRPWRSALSDSAEPLATARRLLARCGAQRLYVADLDALTTGRPQAAVLRGLLEGLPAIELWLDAGFADEAAAHALLNTLGPHAARVRPVYGSESLRSTQPLHEGAVLSLDRRDGGRMDTGGWWDAPARWPGRVIAMTLERVGTDTGPDLETLGALRRTAAPGTRLFGAGGLRDQDDLKAARDTGADGWLVASALHDLRL